MQDGLLGNLRFPHGFRSAYAFDQPIEMCLVSRKASRPSTPSSRPQPLCLRPPKGHWLVEGTGSLMPMVPASSPSPVFSARAPGLKCRVCVRHRLGHRRPRHSANLGKDPARGRINDADGLRRADPAAVQISGTSRRDLSISNSAKKEPIQPIQPMQHLPCRPEGFRAKSHLTSAVAAAMADGSLCRGHSPTAGMLPRCASSSGLLRENRDPRSFQPGSKSIAGAGSGFTFPPNGRRYGP